jgi:type I restriction enzyme M protein
MYISDSFEKQYAKRKSGLGAKENRTKDVFGRVYEYSYTQFASAEGKNGGQFYTPSCVVRLLVEMLAPYKGRVYGPCCGSGGMFVQSEKFVDDHEVTFGGSWLAGRQTILFRSWMFLAIRSARRRGR